MSEDSLLHQFIPHKLSTSSSNGINNCKSEPLIAQSDNNSVIISTDSLSARLAVPVIQTQISIDTGPTHLDNNHYIDKENDDENAGVHFLTDDETTNGLLMPKLEEPETYEMLGNNHDLVKNRNELLEYVIRDDGTVMCKVCSQVLASRTHWYRHKYKVHIVNPTPLMKCNKCNVFFKSRRGYIGHLHSRHQKKTTTESVSTPSIKIESRKEQVVQTPGVFEKNSVLTKSTDNSLNISSSDWEIQREREEKLVADIINRVKKECEAQGTTVTRRGYSRRQTVMNS